MTARKKPSEWREWFNLAATVIGVVVLLGGVATGFFGRFATKTEVTTHAVEDQRAAAWLGYGQAELRETIIGNRVADCEVKLKNGTITDPEVAQCKTWSRELDKARKRSEDAYAEARKVGKGQPRERDDGSDR